MIIDTNFQTPLFVVDYMIAQLPPNIITVCEPTKGLGNISNRLLQLNRYQVITPEDFFLHEITKVDAVIGNPPFSSKSADLTNAPANIDLRGMRVGYYILTECMKISDYLVMLVPWFTISDSDVRLRMLRDFGLKSVTPLPRKTFEYARIQTVVIVLEKGFKGTTTFNPVLI